MPNFRASSSSSDTISCRSGAKRTVMQLTAVLNSARSSSIPLKDSLMRFRLKVFTLRTLVLNASILLSCPVKLKWLTVQRPNLQASLANQMALQVLLKSSCLRLLAQELPKVALPWAQLKWSTLCLAVSSQHPCQLMLSQTWSAGTRRAKMRANRPSLRFSSVVVVSATSAPV